ncbi:hypothetical protein BJY01DRAFT_253407 [Aspergillus pseudoustus]|uniref:DUF7924 domain-containing protein n=1 Tax=Aspergillus pseudoustus TaxID=1810923 RepID=A0ABR4J3G7_9EURO
MAKDKGTAKTGTAKAKAKAKAKAQGRPQQKQQQQQQQAPRRSTRVRKPVEKLGAAPARTPAARTTAARKGKGKANVTATATATASGRGRPKTQQARAQTQGRKRKRAAASEEEEEQEDDDDDDDEERPAKRQQTSPAVVIYINEPTEEQKVGKGAKVCHWIRNRKWPEEGFRRDRDKTSSGADDEEEDDDDDEDDENGGRRNSRDSSLVTKWTPFLKLNDSYWYDGWTGVHDEEKKLLQALAERDCATPQGTVFDANTLRYLDRVSVLGSHTGLAALVFPLLVPFAGVEALRGTIPSTNLADMIGELWDASASLDVDEQRNWQIPEPQPDYSVGVSRRRGLTDAQSEKLEPYLSANGSTSFFEASSDIIFPFLTAEGKDSNGSIKVAEKENMHHMTRSMKGVAELFKLVKRERELDCRILGFSISFDYSMVKIHAHYPVVAEKENGSLAVNFHRSEINSFSFTTQNGRDRWTCYKFVMAIYNDWVPRHFERLCSAIDELPELDLTVNGQKSISAEPEERNRQADQSNQGQQGEQDDEVSQSEQSEQDN